MIAWRVDDEAAGVRLDRHLAAVLGRPRSRLQRWIRDHRVRVEGRAAKPSQIVLAGQLIECQPPPPEVSPAALEPETGDLQILFEDESIVVLDKAADLTVHPGSGRPRGTLANLLVARYPEIVAVGSPLRPGIVHRLDRGTTGVMVIARSDAAYHALAQAFAQRRTLKRYLAIAYGRPRRERAEIELPIGRHPAERRRMAVREAKGRPAHTSYQVLSAGEGVSALVLDLHTGRTHQIRVHLKAVGHPLVGDPLYGEARWRALPRPQQRLLRDFPRPALHAWRLGFAHPKSGESLSFEAPLPDDLAELWRGITGQELSGSYPSCTQPASHCKALGGGWHEPAESWHDGAASNCQLAGE